MSVSQSKREHQQKDAKERTAIKHANAALEQLPRESLPTAQLYLGKQGWLTVPGGGRKARIEPVE